MAILQATKVSSTTEQMAGVGDGQSVKCAAAVYNFTAAPLLNDIIQGSLIQAGSVIVDVVVVLSGFGALSSIKVGYGLDDDYFIAAVSGVSGQVLRMSAPTALPLTLTTNDTVDVTIAAAGATATGSIAIITYFLPRNA